MAGEAVEQAWIGWHGLDADRRYAFMKLYGKSGFPWLTARDYPDLRLYRAFLVKPDEVRQSPVHVLTPDGKELPVRSSELLAELSTKARGPIHLHHDWGGVFDAMDLSIISTGSIASTETMTSKALAVERFRPNILVEIFAERDFPEDKWQKNLIVFGERSNSARIRINRRTLRCAVVNIDPQNGDRNPAILKTIVQQRKNQLGVYGTTERPGTVQVGDVIRMVKD